MRSQAFRSLYTCRIALVHESWCSFAFLLCLTSALPHFLFNPHLFSIPLFHFTFHYFHAIYIYIRLCRLIHYRLIHIPILTLPYTLSHIYSYTSHLNPGLMLVGNEEKERRKRSEGEEGESGMKREEKEKWKRRGGKISKLLYRWVMCLREERVTWIGIR